MLLGEARQAVADYVDGVAQKLLDNAGDRATRVADSPTDAVEGADLVITTITVPLEPKIDCANTDPNALLLPVDYADAMAQAAPAAQLCAAQPGAARS